MTDKVVIELTEREIPIRLTNEEVRLISLLRSLVSERFGSLLINVHEGRVASVEATIKQRF